MRKVSTKERVIRAIQLCPNENNEIVLSLISDASRRYVRDIYYEIKGTSVTRKLDISKKEKFLEYMDKNPDEFCLEKIAKNIQVSRGYIRDLYRIFIRDGYSLKTNDYKHVIFLANEDLYNFLHNEAEKHHTNISSFIRMRLEEYYGFKNPSKTLAPRYKHTKKKIYTGKKFPCISCYLHPEIVKLLHKKSKEKQVPISFVIRRILSPTWINHPEKPSWCRNWKINSIIDQKGKEDV